VGGGGEGEGEGGEGEEEEREEREKAREQAREEKEREQAEEWAREEKERGLRKKVKRRVRVSKDGSRGGALVIDPGLYSGRVGFQRAHHGHEEPFHGGVRVVGAAEQELGPQRDLLVSGIVMLQEAVEVVHHRTLRRRLLVPRSLWANLLALHLLRRALGAPQDHQMGVEPGGPL
jgi:hypothetical protein